MKMCTVEGMAINLLEKEGISNVEMQAQQDLVREQWKKKKMMKYPVKQKKIQVSTRRKRTQQK